MALNIVTGDETFRRGFAFHQAGQMREAEALYWDALRYQPDHVECWHCLGLIAHHVGRNDAAIELMHKALSFKPNDPYIHNNLGEVYRTVGRGMEAVACYRKAMELMPNEAVFYNNIGIVLAQMGQMDDAIASWVRAIDIKADYPEPYNNVGNVYLEQGMIPEAVAAHRKSIELGPHYHAAHSNLLRDLNHVTPVDGDNLLAEHRLWWKMQCKDIKPFPPAPNTRDPERKLRVAYVSPDLREHSVGFFLEAILSRHDPAKFEVTCYANVVSPDLFTDRLHAAAERSANVVGATDEDLAKMVREDQIDIFIDLAGHTAMNRVRAFAYKPAPVQVSYLGYPLTTGGDLVDWKITDPYADPPGMTDRYFSEGLWRLPRTAWCYRPPIDAPIPSELPALKSRAAGKNIITFGSFNSFAKVSPLNVEMWAASLKAVPNSRMIIKANGLADPTLQRRIYGMFSKQGIEPERLSLYGKEPSTLRHLNRYAEVDIGLDTFPYDGTTTTCEAMWMGVPVITLAGGTHISRVGVSLLTNVGMPEFIAQTPEEFARIAARVAGDLDKLAEIRRTLRERMMKSPLRDEEGFVREFEDAQRGMWRKYCAKNP